MTKQEYNFVRAELEREKTASPFYLACRMLPDNWEELKKKYDHFFLCDNMLYTTKKDLDKFLKP